MKKRRLLLSFSGGETSAYMVVWCILNLSNEYDEILIVFANTGQENEQTLAFVDLCDRLLFAPLGHRVIWLEAVQFHGQRKSAGFKIVDFKTASRNGEPFEDAIKKYGIPNTKRPSCTRDLKLAPIQNYADSLGWKRGKYKTAVGIRADEIDRMALNAKESGIIYPLVSPHPRTKPQINSWWEKQPFRLQLKGYQGNCKWCWKKSFRKHFTLISEDPSQYDFPRRMEEKYGLVGAEFRKPQAPGYRRRFFRGEKSVEDLFAMYEARGGDFTPAEDDSVIFDPDLDVGGGCGESCEVFADETDSNDWVEERWETSPAISAVMNPKAFLEVYLCA